MTTTARKPGRPRRKKGEKIRLPVDIVAAEKRRYEQAAKKAGKTLSDWVRDTLDAAS